MRLTQILKSIPYKEVRGEPSGIEVENLSWDSRLVFPQSIFICREGQNYKGIDFLPQIKDRFPAFIVDIKEKDRLLREARSLGKKVFIFVNDVEKISYRLSSLLHNKIDRLKLIGITGTNGKTTVTYLIHKILKEAGYRAALLGTIEYNWANKRKKAYLTTPDFFSLRSLLTEAYNSGERYVVMEVSSHALALGRIKGLNFERAIFTNLTPEHLDFHKNLQDYFLTKKDFFSYLKKRGIAILNVDDYSGARLHKLVRRRKITYSIDRPSLYKVRNYWLGRNHLEFLIKLRKKSYLIRLPLIGRFNIYNGLAGLACGDSLGIKVEIIKQAFQKFRAPSGRLQRIREGIYIDYAHTPEALEVSLQALREVGFKKIISVFGCGGNRDKTKRARMGRVSSLYADYTILTSDNPRWEEPFQICREIARGIKTRDYRIILDRREAIRRSLGLKKDRDTAVLIAGKGHEEYQIFKDQRVKFNDGKIVKELLRIS